MRLRGSVTIPVLPVCLCCGQLLTKFYNVAWCDACLDEFMYVAPDMETMDAFIERKQAEREHGDH